MATRRVYTLLLGNKEREEANHFQLLQEETALAEGRRLGLDVEVAFAPGFDQLRVLKKRLLDGALPPVDAVVTEPANTSTMDLVLRELSGKLGLVILSAGGPSVEAAAPGWGKGPPIGTVGTDHTKVGEIQGRQVRALLPSAFGQKLVAEKLLAASVLTPANTGLALAPGQRGRLAPASRRMGHQDRGICIFTRGHGSGSIPALA